MIKNITPLINIFLWTIIIALALLLRLYKINDKGLIERDEAQYLFAAKGGKQRIDLSIDNYFLKKDIKAISPMNPIYENSSGAVEGKPLLVSLLIFSGIIHSGITDISGFHLSVFFGLLFILAIVLLVIKLTKNKIEGFIAGAIAATSFYHIYHSRIVGHETIVIFLFTIFIYGCLFFETFKIKQVIFLGLIITALITTHGIVILGIFVIILLLFLISLFQMKSIDIKITQNKWLTLFFTTASSLLFIELLYRIASYFILKPGLYSPSGSFLNDIINHGNGSIPSKKFSFAIQDIYYYAINFIGIEGFITCFLIIIGIVYYLHNLKFNSTNNHTNDINLKLVLFSISVYLIYSFLNFKAGRIIICFYPFIIIYAAKGAMVLGQLLSKVLKINIKWSLAFIVLLTLLYNIFHVYPIYQMRSGWKQAGNFIASNTDSVCVTDFFGNTDGCDYELISIYSEKFHYLNPSIKNGIFVLIPNTFRHYGKIYNKDSTIRMIRKYDNHAFIFKPFMACIGSWRLDPLWRFNNYYPKSSKEIDKFIFVGIKN